MDWLITYEKYCDEDDISLWLEKKVSILVELGANNPHMMVKLRLSFYYKLLYWKRFDASFKFLLALYSFKWNSFTSFACNA